MAQRLGMSPLSLTRKAQMGGGYLIKGIHYNQLNDAPNSPFYWNVEKTEEVFENWGAPTKEVQSDAR